MTKANFVGGGRFFAPDPIDLYRRAAGYVDRIFKAVGDKTATRHHVPIRVDRWQLMTQLHGWFLD
jgi:hypothetical protein